MYAPAWYQPPWQGYKIFLIRHRDTERKVSSWYALYICNNVSYTIVMQQRNNITLQKISSHWHPLLPGASCVAAAEQSSALGADLNLCTHEPIKIDSKGKHWHMTLFVAHQVGTHWVSAYLLTTKRSVEYVTNIPNLCKRTFTRIWVGVA